MTWKQGLYKELGTDQSQKITTKKRFITLVKKSKATTKIITTKKKYIRDS